MFARGSLLALAVAVVVALLAPRPARAQPRPARAQPRPARAQPQPHCSTNTYGTITGNPVNLQRVVLSPGQADWDIQIPSEQACERRYGAAAFPVGVAVRACDADVAPAVSVLALNEALVSRRGFLLSDATVDTVVYCAYNKRGAPAGAGGGRNPSPDTAPAPALVPTPAQRPRVSLYVRPRHN